jgi:hypothetical protein
MTSPCNKYGNFKPCLGVFYSPEKSCNYCKCSNRYVNGGISYCKNGTCYNPRCNNGFKNENGYYTYYKQLDNANNCGNGCGDNDNESDDGSVSCQGDCKECYHPCTSKACTGGDIQATSQYKLTIQKQIQNTVRVASSEYTMNIAALNIYEQDPTVTNSQYNSLYWDKNRNQSSDRIKPHNQTVVVASRGSSTRGSITRMRPGACSPGGIGVDIKHNSYDRYLGKLKGKCIPGVNNKSIPNVPSNHILPFQGNKYYKTSITNCICVT